MRNTPPQPRKRLSQAISCAVALNVLYSAESLAQEDKEKALEEVVVTAEKREADLQKTSMSIQVYSGEQLREQGKARIDEIMRGVVGVSSQGSQVGDSFFMRGIGVESGPQPAGTATAPVAVLIDGVYQNRGETVRGGTLDMEQVEVMRGTQSTTLGAASLAGAVSLVSRDPVFDLEGNASLEVGSYNLVNYQGVLNIPLADNQAIRLAYSDTTRDGFISSGAGDSDLTNYRIKYRWQANDDVNLVLSAGRNTIGGNGVDTSVLTYGGYWEPYNGDRDPRRGGNCAPQDCYSVTMGTMYGHINDGSTYEDRSDAWDDGYPDNEWPNNPYRDTTIDTYSADLEWRTDYGTLSFKPSYQNASFKSEEPPRGYDYRKEDREQETVQLDIQWTSPVDASFEWLAGLYYYDTELKGDFTSVGLPGFGAGPFCPPVAAPEQAYCWSYDNNTHETFSAYANGTYWLTEQLRLNAGIRYSDDEKTFVNNPDTPGDVSGPYGGFPFEFSGKRSWDDITYRVGIEYDLSGGDSMVYAVYATGYQPGDIFAFAPNGTKEESLEQFTLGYKSRWLDDSLQFNVEYFNSEYHDRALDGQVGVQVNEQFAPPFPACSAFPVPNPAFYDPMSGYACYFVLNSTVPDLTSEGVDIEVSWLITDLDRLDLSVEFLEAKTTEPDGIPSEQQFLADMDRVGLTDPATLSSLYAELTALNKSYDGLTMQNSPEVSANLTYSHIFEFSSGSELTASFNAEYRDEYWSLGGAPGADIANPGESLQEEYTMFNAFLNWVSADGSWSINAWGKNLSDEAVQTNYAPPFGGGAAYVTLAPPRTYGIGVSVNF